MTSAEFLEKHKGRKARAQSRVSGMNDTEAEFCALLKDKLRAGQIASYRYESVTLIIGGDPSIKSSSLTRYTPDFMVVESNGDLVFYETKRAWKKKDGTYKTGYKGDARTKIRVAAGSWPMFKFIVATKQPEEIGGSWTYEEVR